MNEAHLHLLVNHVPIIGGAFASLVLAWGVIRNNKAVIQTALAVFVLLGVASMVANFTGEGAEEVLEHAGVPLDEALIQPHEEAAELANIAMIVTALLSLATLIVRKLRESRIAGIVVLVLSLVTLGLMARTGMLGGKIRHSEIREATVAADPSGLPPKLEDGDDD